MINQLARVAPATAYTSGTDVLASDITLRSGDGPKLVTVTVAYSAAEKLYVRIDSQNLVFNSDTALVAGAMHAFSFYANTNDPFNFRFAGNGTIRYFLVTEVRE